MRGPTEKQRRFAVAFARLANGTKAAIEAGYAEKSAGVEACRLLKLASVQDIIEASRIRRDVHADVTYASLCELQRSSLEFLRDALDNPDLEFREKVMAYENARRISETVAQCEGLTIRMPEKKTDETAHTLQLFAQRLRAEPVKALPSPQPPTEGKVAV